MGQLYHLTSFSVPLLLPKKIKSINYYTKVGARGRESTDCCSRGSTQLCHLGSQDRYSLQHSCDHHTESTAAFTS